MLRNISLICFILACLIPIRPISGQPGFLPKKAVGPPPPSQIWPVDFKQINAAKLKTAAPSYKFKNKPEMLSYLKGLSRSYGLPYKLMRQILAVESNNCRYRHNKRTNDHGCFQISAITMKLYGWNQDTVSNNDLLNAHAAAIILNDLKKQFSKLEPQTYHCRYNIGWRSLPKSCQAYLRKLELAKL